MLPKNSKRGPSNTIDPDDYPEEAKRWLLEYPERDVRLSMAKEWLTSSRPETPTLIRQHIKWLKTLPEDIPYWSAGPGESWKKDKLKSLEREAKEFEVGYQRWIEDGKHKNINAGSYTDEYWEGYKKERAAERAKERAPQTNMSTSAAGSTQ